MTPDVIFTKGWELNMLIYGLVFLLARYSVYKIVFRGLIGVPKSHDYDDQRYWYRNASFLSAVVFAPLYEEIMFTYLAYASFISYAQEGKEGLVIIFVAVFFALLHLPGDLSRTRYLSGNAKIYSLFRGQLDRFFYSLAAYIIYQWTGWLWTTIALHYFYNALVSFYNFDLEDQPDTFGRRDDRLLLILLLDVAFAVLATYFFYEQYPSFGLYLIPLLGFVLLDSFRIKI